MSSTSTADVESVTFKRDFEKKWTDFKFSSHSDYLMMTFACSFTIKSIFAYLVLPFNPAYPNIIQIIVTYLVVGLPLTYMQIVTSQYSQLGVILFKHICPLSYGLGCAAVLISFMWCCYYGIILGDVLLYFITCVESPLYWTQCPSNSEDRCWSDASTCTSSCLSNTIATSAVVYWKETFMGHLELTKLSFGVGKPIIPRLVTLILGWMIVYGILSTGIETYKKIIRVNCYVILIFSVIIGLVSCLSEGGMDGDNLLFANISYNYLSLNSWTYSVLNVTNSLALSRVCHHLYGTYTHSQTPSDFLAMLTVTLSFLFGYFAAFIIHANLGIIATSARINLDNIVFITHSPVIPYCLTIVPEALGLMGVAQLWNALYFIVIMMIICNNLVSQIDGIERAIIDIHPKVIVYRYYMLTFLCISCVLYGICFCSSKSWPLLVVFADVLMVAEIIILFLMTLCIFWIYGVQRICDDIHFLQGSQPSNYWKYMWYISPIVLGYILKILKYEEKPEALGINWYQVCSLHFLDSRTETIEEKGHFWFSHITLLFLTIPVPIFMIYELLYYLKIHRIVAIMQPEERWGPVDPEERHLRRLFNPREEIRSRRRDNTCPHTCLIEDKYVDQTIEEENLMRRTEPAEQSDLDVPINEDSSITDIFSSDTEFENN